MSQTNLRSMMLVLFLVLSLCLPLPTYAKDAAITNFIITNTPENVIIYCRVINCFTQKMEDAILAGIPTTFTFYVELRRERNYWFDKEISSLEIKHTVKYDTVKKIFYVMRSGSGKEPEQFRDFATAKRVMSNLDGVAVSPMKELVRGRSYYVTVKAMLDKVRLPLHMEYVLFFVSLWDFETDLYREDFIY
ncbi:MAG: DUF4390 domain-containing protein [Deltaproteobacteria bacterium]|nr:DUF4390 domain-containing protein [Deltaproteobacteria bacterium]MBN2686824.1 DUF4390 domain-containing protein [Deltaproteobacteria bacterium]